MALVGVLVAVLAVAARESRQADGWATHSAGVLGTVQGIERRTIDLETGVRGYAATGDRYFLAPWRAARVALPNDLATLHRLVADNRFQAARAAELTAAVEAYITTYTEPFVAAARLPSRAALHAFMARGKQLLDALRMRFDRFTQVEQRLQAAREQRSERAEDRLVAIGALAALTIVLALVAYVLFVARSIALPVRRVIQACVDLSTGMRIRIARDGRGELAALGDAFNEMADRLNERETAMRDAEQRAVRERDFAATVTRSMREGFMLTRAGVILDVNQALCELTGYTRNELVGATVPYPFWAPESIAQIERERDLIDEAGHEFDTIYLRRDGSRFDASIASVVARASTGELLGYVSTIRDVTERKAHEAQLRALATEDALTGLANRRAFEQRLREDVARARRTGQPLAVAIIDIDRFKTINDTHGHPVGDRVLAEIGRRLAHIARAGEMVARIGGEEFGWILDAHGVDAVSAAERIRRAVSDTPYADVGTVTASVGVCNLVGAATAEELYRCADAALYRAKAEGRDRVCGAAPSAAPAR